MRVTWADIAIGLLFFLAEGAFVILMLRYVL